MEVGDLAGRGLRYTFGCDERFLGDRLLEYLVSSGRCLLWGHGRGNPLTASLAPWPT